MSKTEQIELTLNQGDQNSNGNLALAHTKPKLKQPSMYKVIMYNDDYTPMEFVVEILQVFFTLDQAKATEVMLTVHTQGKAICGVYSRDIAETKVAQVNQFACDREQPLLCGIDKAD